MASLRVVHVQAQVQWVFTQDAPSGHWVAVCEPLGLTVEGHTHSEMREHIDEALNLILTNMVKTGEIEKFLRDRGWRAQGMPSAAQLARQKVRFDVPIELIAQRAANGSARKVH